MERRLLMATLLELAPSRVDIQALREQFAEALNRRRNTLNNRGFATTVSREPTDAQLRAAARNSQKFENLIIASVRPVNFAAARLISPRRYPRIAVG
jgi:hypothetical protein